MDKNTRIKTLYKSYLKRYDKDPFYPNNGNISFEEVGRDIWREIYTPYSFNEFYKELFNDDSFLSWDDSGCFMYEGPFSGVYGDPNLKHNFKFDKFNNITKDNFINYCHFLLKHKGKLHNALGNNYKSTVKHLTEIIETDKFQEDMPFLYQSISFTLRYKYDKKIKQREIDYQNGIAQKRYKKKCKFQTKQIKKLNKKLNVS